MIGDRTELMNERKILLIDDEEMILDLLETMLKKEGYINISKATSGRQAINECNIFKPDLIILDIMLPDIDGFEVCRQIRETTMVPIIFLSARVEEIDKVLSYMIGGDDYVEKPFSPRELMAHITAVFRRTEYYEKNKCAQIFRFGKFCLNFDKRELYHGDSIVELTHKEYLLLEYLIENRNITISKTQILDKVWGIDFDGYENTVMVHIRRLREKIEENPSNPSYIITVKGRGYRFEYA